MQKGPYFNPVQYISPLPEGYMQASTNIANTLGKAAQGIGQTIASSIEQYTKNKEESQFLDEKFQMTTGNLEKYKTDPKFAEDPRAKKLAEGVGKFAAMSNSQKKSFLNNADFAVSQFDREAAIDYKKLQDQREYELAAQKALIDAATFRSNEELNAARIADLRRGFEPTAKTVTLPDGTVVPLVSTGKDQFQVVSKPTANKPQSPVGQLLADLADREAAGDTVGAAVLKKQVEQLGVKPVTPLNEGQAKSLTFYNQARQNREMIETSTYKPANITSRFPMLESMKSDERKGWEAAANNWIEATLRDKSGSGLKESEYEEARAQYFELAGDGKDVIEQKRQRRLGAEASLRAKIGPDANHYINESKIPEEQLNNIPEKEQNKTPKAPQNLRKFESMADAEAARASGFTGVAEIFDPATGKYPRYFID